MDIKKKSEWKWLINIPEGSLFETKDGVQAVKSEYRYGNEPDSQCKCILLESGEYAHFKNKNHELVRVIDIDQLLQESIQEKCVHNKDNKSLHLYQSIGEVYCNKCDACLGVLVNSPQEDK